MGVTGFPTLKIIKPSKTPGKPIVEDYQGPRTTGGIVDAVKLAIPNHVKRISDKSLNEWLESSNDTAKAILFSEKGTTGALIKVLATEFSNSLKFAQIRNKETAAVEMFGVSKFPTLLILPGGNKEPVKFEGSFSKAAMMEFLSPYASAKSESTPKTPKPSVKEPEKKATKEAKPSSKSKPSSASKALTDEFDEATTIILGDPSEPTESPDPNVVPEDAPKPVPVAKLPPPIPPLAEEKALQTQCLGEKTTTCILALLPKAANDEAVLLPDATQALSSLAELAEKHVQRGGKLFPFYSIPAENFGATNLRNALKLAGDDSFELIAVNARRGWWRKFKSQNFDVNSVENWVDNIRFGEGEKGRLPDELVVAEEVKEEVEEQPMQEPKEEKSGEEKVQKETEQEHDEL